MQFFFRVLFIITITIFNKSVLCQQKFYWSKPFEIKKTELINDIIGEDLNHLFVFKTKEEGLFHKYEVLEKYSKNNFDILFSKKLETSKTKNDFIKIILVENQIFLFYTQKDSKKGIILCLQKFDLDGNNIESPIELDCFQEKWDAFESTYDYFQDQKDADKFPHYNNVQVPCQFLIEFSPNKSFFAIIRHNNFKANSNETFNIKVYDAALKLSYEKSIELNIPDFCIDFEKSIISNNGDVSLLALRLSDGYKTFDFSEINFSYLIFEINSKIKKLSEYKIELENKKISECNFIYDHNSNLVCCGFYSSLNNYKNGIQEGFYLFRFDNSHTSVTKESVPIHLNSSANEKSKTPIHYKPMLILEENNGRITVVSEQQSSRSLQMIMNPNMGTSYNHFNNILISTFNSNGKFEWKKEIYKKQCSINGSKEEFLSFDCFMLNGTIMLLINENKENINLDLLDVTYHTEYKELNWDINRKKSSLIQYRISSEGVVNKELIGNFDDVNVLYRSNFRSNTLVKNYSSPIGLGFEKGIYRFVAF